MMLINLKRCDVWEYTYTFPKVRNDLYVYIAKMLCRMISYD
jgi:hypothetical protein